MMSSELDQVTDAPTTGRSFSRSRTAPAVARRFVRDFLADAGANARCQQVGELLVSELVTNALVHARTSARLRVSVTDGDARVEVTDDGPGQPRLRVPGPDGGYGLWLTDTLSRSWGVTHRDDTPGSSGKTVWFTVPLAAPPAQS
jgi:anti-sigma regulatory factor (Ser/Thr protein kinase)